MSIDPSWLPRENGAVTGSWHIVLRYAIAHSAANVWFEQGVNREPMQGRQVQHLAIVMNDVLCLVRVEDGLCIPSLDEVRDRLAARVAELGELCPDVVRSLVDLSAQFARFEADGGVSAEVFAAARDEALALEGEARATALGAMLDFEERATERGFPLVAAAYRVVAATLAGEMVDDHEAALAPKVEETATVESVVEKIAALRSKKDALAFAAQHHVAAVTDAMKLAEMKDALVSALAPKVEEPKTV